MAQETNKTGMRDLPEKQMTQEQINALMCPLGVPGAPFPMARIVQGGEKDAVKGAPPRAIAYDVGLIQSANALFIPSEMPRERVYGIMMREAATPQLMFMTRDVIQRIQPGSTNRVFAVLGDPSCGKSHEFKKISRIIHPKGAKVIDCGGMNMRELFFRTEIDYGRGVKEQFEKRLAKGNIMQHNVDLLNASFPGFIVEKDGKKAVDWAAMGAPKQVKDADGKVETVEDRGAAKIRAVDLLKSVYEEEGITTQHNSFGIKTVPGELIECWNEGRPVFLDEFTKCQRDTLDAFQTYLDWINGNDTSPSVMLQNPMPTSDGESPAFVELHRKDIKLGFVVGVAGNESKDGVTTHTLSDSMIDRLHPLYVGAPQEKDFSHRISQVYTGLPLTTLYNLFQDEAKARPDQFAEYLWKLRTLGLSAEEVKVIPPHEQMLLKNFGKTVQAINQLAAGYYQQSLLSDPESILLGSEPFRDCEDEIAAHGKKMKVTLRVPLAEFKKSLQGTPEVMEAATAKLSFDFGAALNNFEVSLADQQPGWHSLGKNIARVRMEAIANATQDMPKTSGALLTLWEMCGVFPPDFKEAKMSKDVKPVAELLKYDPLAIKGLGNTEELTALRNVLSATLRGLYPSIKATDEQLIPLEVLAGSLQAMEGRGEINEDRSYVVPNDDLNDVSKTPLTVANAMPNILMGVETPADIAESGDWKLVDFRTALSALALPDFRQKNFSTLWPVELVRDGYTSIDQSLKPDELHKLEEAHKILTGESAGGFDFSVLAAAGKNGKGHVYMYLLNDRFQDKTMILGPEDIPTSLQVELARRNVTYVTTNDESSADKINNFLTEGIRHRIEKSKMQGDVETVLQRVLQSLSLLYGDQVGDGEEFSEKTKLGQTLFLVTKQDPAVFTSIVQRVGKKGGPAV